MKALHGTRVLDLTRATAGSYCALNLSHMGADIVRIERPRGEGPG